MASRDGDTALIALLSFVLGGAIGAAVALLYAPQAGKRTRKDIREFAEEVKEEVADYAEKVKKTVS
ncbi:MAG: hypothetical protein Kow0025_21970 [Thermodesulfovibrionales bacterium]